MRDIIIIGGGVVGCAVARELSRYKASILLLEKGNDVAVGASKANSGIVHGGHDAVNGSKKAYFNVMGNKMFDQLSKELDFPFVRNGSLVLNFGEEGNKTLCELLERGVKNGVEGLEILTGDQVRVMEPNVSKEVVSALYIPTGGIVSPYEMTIAYAENASVNGVEFKFNQTVQSVKPTSNGFDVVCGENTYQAQFVINCAGIFSDEINNMVCQKKIKIVPRKGDYVLLDNAYSNICSKTLFQLPDAMGKGILVTPTAHGNILVGPTALDIDDKEDVDTTAKQLDKAYTIATRSVPNLPRRAIITQFAGLRAHGDQGDFVIGESQQKGFYNCACIESPGLTSAPAIAVHVAGEVAEKLSLTKKEDFVATRKGIPQFSRLDNESRQRLIKENPLFGKIVCRCEMVTEAEIVMAINRPVGAKDLDGIKRRTRSGMGRCQAGFCTPRLVEILQRELNVQAGEVTKCGGDSVIVVGRTK